ncbi:hypothetical protein ACA910_021132 [Epithemia clementina (nom. ined.)]
MGPLFRTVTKAGTVKRATVSHLDDLFHNILRCTQLKRPDVIPRDAKIDELYSVRRSLWRGATTEAQNRKIPDSIIESNNRWKKQMRAHGVLSTMSMLERDTDAKASVETIIQFLELM